MSIFLILFTYATWTTIFALGKQTLEFCSPLFLTSTRMILAGILLLSYLAICKPHFLKIQKKHIFPLILLAFLCMYLSNFFEFWGMKHGLSAAKTCFIYSLSPFFAVFFSYMHFNEKMNIRKWLGMLVGFFGVISSFLFQSESEKSIGGIGFISWPELSLCAATLCSVYGWVLLRLLVKEESNQKSLSPLFVNGSTMLLGGIFALIHSFFIDSWSPLPVPLAHLGVFAREILLMTFISNILCYNLYGYLLKKFTNTILSFFGLLSPFFSSLSAWWILGEKPSLVICLSTCVVLLGLWIVYREELRLGYVQKSLRKEKALQANFDN